MLNSPYPQPPTHKTFNFGPVTIDSNFDSGNCCNVEKVSLTNYNIWIGTDHPKNNYRTWFYFSIVGLSKGITVTFTIKNMQNQSRLLSEGLVPVYREESSKDWKRIHEKVNLNYIEYYDGWIQWMFKHTMTSNQKVFLAFFYPWSNQDNRQFLNHLENKVKEDSSIYFYCQPIIRTLEGRPVEFVVISSQKGKGVKEEKIQDPELFKNAKKPISFHPDKKVIVLGARVHPGEVPGSHVMTGILEELTSNTEVSKLLRDNFVFYIFPIFNPDGVARGHYRVDTNGINLNRCYLNPSAKAHPPIYAVKSLIMYLHAQSRFFAFLDLHAHASRKGTFIYGNSTNQLVTQMQTCIFPKILSMNSQDFEYEGSNFTEKNMYCKDRADHVSKEGSGRVAIFKSTKNPYCWTLQCNYNMSRVHNILEPQKNPEDQVEKVNENNLSEKIIIQYRYPPQRQAKQFFTIKTYVKLGRQICESFLDLIEKNPYSRIQNPESHFKSLKNLKMQLAVALLRMAASRFQQPFRKIYTGMLSEQNTELVQNSMKALYFIIIKNAKIQNLQSYLKEGTQKYIIFPSSPKKKNSISQSLGSRSVHNSSPEKNSNIRIKKKISAKDINEKEIQTNGSSLFVMKNQEETLKQITLEYEDNGQQQRIENQKIHSLLFEKLSSFDKQSTCNKVALKVGEFRLIGLSNLRSSIASGKTIQKKKPQKQNSIRSKSKLKLEQMPLISGSSGKRNFLGVNIKTSHWNEQKVLFGEKKVTIKQSALQLL